ncbi:hypothetical protein [Bifidobacterium phasiani]|uniref:Uncharacterized protein n=1 Tax=Bifidobacterium phasiani TaxID=2834431 RepID=A0ABS6W8M4_9BIFI|nr:hypothetical protein [Bifidobacterium phasiani]MBW3082439.1 hypothetical protein [Bifidobacterium phasiani]
MPLEPTHRYDDIIDLPHHRSRRHPPMSRLNRAAQFMPFAALTGYEAIIAETASRNEARVEAANTPVDGLDEGWVAA